MQSQKTYLASSQVHCANDIHEPHTISKYMESAARLKQSLKLIYVTEPNVGEHSTHLSQCHPEKEN